MLFYWVDDQRDKYDSAKPLLEKPRGSRTKRAETQFLDAGAPEDLMVAITGWAEMPRPDLLLLDHVFNKTRRRNRFRIAGSTVAHVLRRNWPEVPMVCLTAMLQDTRARRTHSDRESEAQYLTLFQYETLSERVPQIYAIARDFPKVVKAKPSSGEDVAQLLGVPDGDREVFLSALPLEFKAPFDASTPHRLSRWIIQVLREYPGFLYSELRAATYLGLSVAGYRKVQSHFSSARYKGPFAFDDAPMWWVDRLRTALYKAVPANAPSDSWRAGRQLPGLAATDYSVCHVNHSEGDVPDTVALLYPRGQEVAVCAKYTSTHPDKISPPGFEEIKVVAESR